MLPQVCKDIYVDISFSIICSGEEIERIKISLLRDWLSKSYINHKNTKTFRKKWSISISYWLDAEKNVNMVLLVWKIKFNAMCTGQACIFLLMDFFGMVLRTELSTKDRALSSTSNPYMFLWGWITWEEVWKYIHKLYVVVFREWRISTFCF